MRNDLLNTACCVRIDKREGYKTAQKTPKGTKSEPKSRLLCEVVLSDAVGRCQGVEKVDVGPVGDPKEAQNKVKTLQKRRSQPLSQRLKRARRSFSTRWCILGSLVLA
jgi:hypothetical protein